MRILGLTAIALGMALSAADAEPVKITNIGHGYYSGALYVAKQEKLFEKYGLEPDITFVQGGPLALQAALTRQADVSIVSYEHILDAFFSLHDPTTLNRQGPDWGTQYRSAIFFHSPEQEKQARAKIEQLTAEGRFKPKRIVSRVEPAQTFWRAEEYHQRYLEKRGQASCHI